MAGRQGDSRSSCCERLFVSVCSPHDGCPIRVSRLLPEGSRDKPSVIGCEKVKKITLLREENCTTAQFTFIPLPLLLPAPLFLSQTPSFPW